MELLRLRRGGAELQPGHQLRVLKELVDRTTEAAMLGTVHPDVGPGQCTAWGQM